MRPVYLWQTRPCLVCGKDAVQTGQRPRLYCSRRCKGLALRRRHAAARVAVTHGTCTVCGVAVPRRSPVGQLPARCLEHLKRRPVQQPRERRARCECGAPVPAGRLRYCSEVCMVSFRIEHVTDRQRERRHQRLAAECRLCPCGRVLRRKVGPGGRQSFCQPCAKRRQAAARKRYAQRQRVAA